jgi:hypothetical protein
VPRRTSPEAPSPVRRPIRPRRFPRAR